MDAETSGRILLLLFMFVDMWGVLCGIDLVKSAWSNRKVAPVMQGYAEMGLYMTMNAVLWLLILGQAFIWPATEDTNGPGWRTAALTSVFFLASATITLALHRGRSLMSGQPRGEVAPPAKEN